MDQWFHSKIIFNLFKKELIFFEIQKIKMYYIVKWFGN